MAYSTDHNLLVGILALQMGFVTEAQHGVLVEALGFAQTLEDGLSPAAATETQDAE